MISLHERTAEFVATRKPLHGSQEAVIALDTAYALIAELDAALKAAEKALREILWDCDNCKLECPRCSHVEELNDLDLADTARRALAQTEAGEDTP